MKKQLVMAIVFVLSWACATMFTHGINDLIEGYLKKHHHRFLAHMSCFFVLLVLLVGVSYQTNNY